MHKQICFYLGDMSQIGGTERSAQLLANEMAKDTNYDIYFISKYSSKGDEPYFALDKRIKYQTLYRQKEKRKSVFSFIKRVRMLKQFVKKHHIEVLINVETTIGIDTLLLEFICPKLKQIFWDHFSTELNYADRWEKLLGRTRKLAVKYGEAYVTLTSEDADNIKRIRTNKSCIVSIPNICPFTPSKTEYNMKSKLLISVGNTIHTKGYDIALKTACGVFRKHPDCSWYIYGDGDEKKDLQDQAKALGIDDHVHFMGYADDLDDMYTQASIYIMTSRTEGFGLVLLEAQAHHLPTVAFDVPYGPRNIIEDNLNGFLCKPFDTDEMADKICELIENEEKRKTFSNNSQLNIDKFSAENVANKWKELLEKM